VIARGRLRAGMVASRLGPVEHTFPALTDHFELGGVIGTAKVLNVCVTFVRVIWHTRPVRRRDHSQGLPTVSSGKEFAR
jgi:hypothetical protein